MPPSTLRKLFCVASLAVLASTSFACKASAKDADSAAVQTSDAPQAKQLPSPPANASVTFGQNASINIDYHSPRARGRKIFGGVVPYGHWWRTGANPATTFVTKTDVKVGTLNVPAGSYTLVTVPAEGTWQLVINKQTGQWGTEYDPSQDLGHTPMKGSKLASPQENMSISFENKTANSVELHIRWENTEESVLISAAK